MKTGTGLAVIAIGAILAFAVTANTSVINLNVAGWVLMIVGVIGLGIEEITYPTSVNRNPANTRVQAGLPAPGALGGSEASGRTAPRDLSTEPIPGEAEIVEDVYED
jgi:hypothetical protein